MTAIVRDNIDEKRRRLLLVATSGAGAVIAAAAGTPMLLSWFPSARALAAGAPVEADISKLEFFRYFSYFMSALGVVLFSLAWLYFKKRQTDRVSDG